MLLGAGALLVPLLQGAASAVQPARVGVAGATPSWASPARLAGTPAGTEQVAIRIGLRLRGGDAAQQLAEQVSNPASREYGKYLTPAAFTQQFAPTRTTVDQVSQFLTGAGLRVTGVAGGNLWIDATGSVAQLDKAFGTALRTYSVGGKSLRAPSGQVSVPAEIAASITTVSGLADKPSQRAPLTRRVAPEPNRHAAGVAAPTATRPPISQCSDYWGQHSQTLPQAYGQTQFNTYICGYAPAQLRTAYGTSPLVKHGLDGHGVTVAIIDAYASPTMLADANAYADTFGEPRFGDGQYTETTFEPFNLQDECGGEGGWNGEQTLDVEAVHGMAPGANIHYIGAQNCDTGIDDALNYVVQHHVADIVSNSYGNTGEAVPADEVALDHAIFIQAAAEGIGMYFSSGDSGDNVVNGLSPQPDYQASDPDVTAVGGTSLLLDKSNQRVAEVGWETTLDFVDYSGTTASYDSALPGDFYFGAGGGTSTLFAEPWYQRGTVPRALANGHRVVPDLAADADPYTGFYIGQTNGGEFGIGTIGGTSLACPLIAGIQAVASQGRRFPIGFANPLIYSMRSAAFQDVAPHAPIRYASVGGSYLGTFDTGDTQSLRYGYDNITGRGTPNGVFFVGSEIAR